MMIVDFHSHIIDYSWLPERWWKWLTEYYNSRRIGSLLQYQNADDVTDRMCDSDGSKLLGAMEEAGIQKSVVLPLDWGLLLGEPAVPIEEQHRKLAQISERSAGKIIPFVGVDPRRENALEMIKFCLEDYKMKGIKLYPAAGYDLHDAAYRPVFEAAMKYDVPVLLHTGYSFGPFLSKYCDPVILDHLCATYPNVTFIAAHLGAGYLEQLSWLGYSKPNLYTDCSLMQVRLRQNYSEFARNLRLACDLFGSKRILFGTDWPFSQSVMDNGEYIKMLRKLAGPNGTDSKFASYEIKNILSGSSEELLTSRKALYKRPSDFNFM
jgi:predicted TIM-barrel fold metal-dependent hydrolase